MIVKASVAQVGAVPFDVPASVSKAEEWVARAGTDGCHIVVFPEAFIAGYPKGADFDISIGRRTERGRDEFRRYFEASINVPGPETQRLAKSAVAANAYVVIGVMERDLSTYIAPRYFFRTRWDVVRQAPQTDADGRRAPDLGLRRRLDPASVPDTDRQHWRGDLLGELYADAAHPRGWVRFWFLNLNVTPRRDSHAPKPAVVGSFAPA
jgi:hypothetical protein